LTQQLASVAGLLPDVPHWIEARSMLLQGQARLIGPLGVSPPTFVALHCDGDQAAVVGRAPRASIVEAASSAEEIIVAVEDTPWVASTLPDWKQESAMLFRRDVHSPLPRASGGEVRFLATDELLAITGAALMSETLADELRSAEKSGVPIAAAFEEGQAVAFCYAGSITETLWDVAIDTLELYQRRGHATKVATFLIEHYQALGKEPVWGAFLSNEASVALAARLGFLPVGSLSVFSAPCRVVP
jgi:RimJ/RimL family protein N-acetyltransferase